MLMNKKEVQLLITIMVMINLENILWRRFKMAYVNFSKELKRLWADIKNAEKVSDIWRHAYFAKGKKYRDESNEARYFEEALEKETEARKALSDFKKKYKLK